MILKETHYGLFDSGISIALTQKEESLKTENYADVCLITCWVEPENIRHDYGEGFYTVYNVHSIWSVQPYTQKVKV